DMKQFSDHQVIHEKEITHPSDVLEQGIKPEEDNASNELPLPSRKVEQEPIVETTERIPPLYPIGQLQGTYILAQNENGLYMIDQHAAQERIKYEVFKEKLGKPVKHVQELLLPITFDFSQR